MIHKKITKYDFLSYFKNPYCLWFLDTEEIKEYLHDTDYDFENILEVLKELNNPDSIVSTNSFEMLKIKNKKLIDFYKNFFSIPTPFIWDFSAVNEDVTAQVEEVLKSNELAFIFMPLFSSSTLQIRPTALYKYKKSIYLIEHVWSSSLKKESIGVFAFYDYFLKKNCLIKIDQYLISYLSNSSILFGNSLPFSIKQKKPDGFIDKKLKNINSYFGLTTEYHSSLYEKICSKADYENLNNDNWDLLVDVENPIQELEQFSLKPNRELIFSKLSSAFFSKKTNWIQPDSKSYRFLLKQKYNFTIASSLIPFSEVMTNLSSLSEIKKKDFYGFLEDQDYLVYEDAVNFFNKELKSKSIKIYYDFETMALPFPIHNFKPYQPIVFQASLIKTVDGKESEVVNLVNDPLNFSVSDFRSIVDHLYSNKPDAVYLVYNKSFEISRLKEISLTINDDDYHLKILEIIDRTIDLGDYFKLNKSPRLVLKNLRGFWSIKEVSKLIPEDILKESKTLNYGDLECQNGLMASQLFLYRWLNKCDSRVWNCIKSMLIKYCENDVRSMIAVEMFIEKLIHDNKHPLRTST